MQHKKIFHNKKALSEFILDIWSYLVFAVAVFFFLVVFQLQSITAVQHQLTGISEIPASSSTLINYLRTPILLDGKETNIAELIRLWSLEPSKYEDALEKNSIDILNNLEYEYENPQMKNIVIRGFDIIINTKKMEDNVLDYLIDFKSNSFDSGFVIRNEYGVGRILAEQFVPISEDKSLYLVLMESQRAK